jgi:hypothetical protein
VKPLFFIHLLIFFYSFLSFSSASAQNSLNNLEIEHFINTLPAINALVNEFESDNEQQINNLPTDFSRTPITDSLNVVRTPQTLAEFTSIINRSGFSSAELWAQAGDKIIMAYSAYHLKYPQNASAPNPEEIKLDLTSQLTNIKRNQFISNEQKQTLINKIQNSIALLSDPNYIDSENISIISPYIDRLNSLLKEYQ